MFTPVRLIFKFGFALYFFLTLAVLYPLFYFFLAKRRRFKKAFELKRFWSILLQMGFFSWISKKQEAELPEGPFIICSNHTSFLDIIIMYRIIPRYFIFMGKNELLKWPLFKTFFKKQDIAVNRHNPSSAARAFSKAKEVLKNGDALAIFPEGTIPKHAPKLKPFKDGAFKLAIECQVPIVPVTFLTHWRMLGDAESIWGRVRPGVSKIIIHAPIPTAGMTDKDLLALRNQVFNTIDSSLKKHGSN